MSYEITYQTISASDSASGQEEKLIVAQDTGSGSSNPVPIAIAVDYSGYIKQIADQLTPTVALTGDIGAQALADQITRVRQQLTPIVSEAENNTLADQIAKIRASVRYNEKRLKMARLYISDGTGTNGTIGIDDEDTNDTYSTTMTETGNLNITSNRPGYTKLYLVNSQSYFPLVDNTIEQVYVARDTLTGQGTPNITWATQYGDGGTYYLYREVSENYILAGTITINDSPWITDEKITGSTNGTTGYIETFSASSKRGKRFLDIIDIERFDTGVDNITEDFVLGETITGSESGNTATIEDIIYFNHEHENYNTAGKIGAAALYKLLVDEGSILNVDNNVDGQSKLESLDVLSSYIAAVGRI
jgi:hypothetical protein